MATKPKSFGDRFSLGTPYSPTLADANRAPGMINLSGAGNPISLAAGAPVGMQPMPGQTSMPQMQPSPNSPMPGPAGGVAPGIAATANGVGGASVPPGAAGAQSPGNIMTGGQYSGPQSAQ